MEEDVSNFVSGLVDIAAYAVQFDTMAKLVGVMDISEVCDIMTDKRNRSSALENLAHLNAV